MSNLKEVLNASTTHIPSCYWNKALAIDKQLSSGAPFTGIGGKRIHQSRAFVRFRIGRGFRLIYQFKSGALVPLCLIPRQQFEQLLKRKRKLSGVRSSSVKQEVKL